MDRFNYLPNHRYYENADGVIYDSNGKPLRGYSISGENVGDYDEENGKYIIPIQVCGKNLFDENILLNNPYLASVNDYGIAIGRYASTNTGISIGNDANTETGIAIGNDASANIGIAIGNDAYTFDDEQIHKDNIQIGTGCNKKEKTVQFYNFQILDRNGHIPEERLSNIMTINEEGKLVITLNGQSYTFTPDAE